MPENRGYSTATEEHTDPSELARIDSGGGGTNPPNIREVGRPPASLLFKTDSKFKQSGTQTVIVPSAAVESMNFGSIAGITAMAQGEAGEFRSIPKPPKP